MWGKGPSTYLENALVWQLAHVAARAPAHQVPQVHLRARCEPKEAAIRVTTGLDPPSSARQRTSRSQRRDVCSEKSKTTVSV